MLCSSFVMAVKIARSLSRANGGERYVLRRGDGYAVVRWLAWGDVVACRVSVG